MNDIIFSNGFRFCTFKLDTFHHTDNRCGAPCHYFAYMLSGNCKIATEEGEVVEISEGDIFYIPNKCSYQSYWYGKPEIKFISLGFPSLPNFENKNYPVQVIPYNSEAEKLFYEIADVRYLKASDIGVLYTLAGVLLPTMTSRRMCRSKEIVDKTKQYLTMHPFAKAQELAKNCAVSEAALYAAFQKSSDITPNILRGHLLLEKAKDMLITTDKSIEYISDYFGFSSASYFRKKFKEYFSVTPRDMRKKYRI